MILQFTKEKVTRKIRGEYTPENKGKEEAYARLLEDEDPEIVLRDFLALAQQLRREENEADRQRHKNKSQPVLA